MGYPIRAGTNSVPFNAGGGTSHNAALPATVENGDRVLAVVMAVDPTTTVTTPSGWTKFGSDNTGGSGTSGHVTRWYYRDATGSEGGNNVDWVTSADVDVGVKYVRYLAGTFAAGTAPELAVADNSSNANPPSLDPSGWAGEPTAWIAGYARFAVTVTGANPAAFYNAVTVDTTGTNSVGGRLAFKDTWESTVENPGLFGSTEVNNYGAYTVAIRGQTYTIPGVEWVANGSVPSSTATTTFTITIPSSVVDGDDLYVACVSRDHTAGTALATLTDDDTGGNTWTLIQNSTDRKAYLWWKKATSGTASKTVTFAGGVGSSTGGLTAFRGAAATPHTNIVLEDNASGNETHAAFTPDEDNSMVVGIVYNVANDNDVTDLVMATLGPLEEQFFENESTGGSDCKVIMGGRLQVGTAADTGAMTWAQTNGVTVSITFAIKPDAAQVLSGALFSQLPTFHQGTVTLDDQFLTGALFTNIGVFSTGVVTLNDQFLDGVLFVANGTFFVGVISQGGEFYGWGIPI